MGRLICNFVKSILGVMHLDLVLNRTLLVLILKIQSPERIAQFRPISLCSVVYKIITKTIVNRLRPSMTRLVGQHQSNFIPGRDIADNIIVAH